MADSKHSFSMGLGRQLEIYQQGTMKQLPTQPISVEALEAKARELLKPEAYGYVAGGAGSEDTMRANLDAFRNWRLVPRLLQNVAQRDLSVEILGQTFPTPILLAPIGVLGILHPDAEVAVARAAQALSIPMILSSVSSKTIEEVGKEAGDNPRWFQLYWPRDNELAASFLHRAESSGFSAIVLTLDTYLLAWRERDLQNAYLPFLYGDGLANYFSDPVFQKAVGGDPRANPQRTFEHFAKIFSDPSRTWDDLATLREQTSLPIILKGILHPEDAKRAVNLGASGIIVSNHGGRQLDGGIAALDSLPAIVDAVGEQITVLFDSGIRRGADVIKAMALGAKGVLLGRPYCYGLAVGGEQGIRDVLMNLLADVDLTLGLIGCTSFHELGPERLIRMT